MKKPALQKVNIKSLEFGTLGFAETTHDIQFPIRRHYWLDKNSPAHNRGAHAHKDLEVLMICLRGSVKVTLRARGESHSFVLNSPDIGLYIPQKYWRDLTEMTSDSLVSILASKEYDESDYIRNWDEFERWEKELRPQGVPYLDFRRQYEELKMPLLKKTEEVLENGHYILGREVQNFEKDFASRIGTKHVIGVGTGLDAITLALRAWGVGPGDEVIVPANSFVATALGVTAAGATPVLVDNDPATYNINPNLIAQALTNKTKAIALTHLYGQSADMDPILDIARKKGLKVFEDAAQAHGATYRGRPCGGLGDAAGFSFYPTKNLGAFGDGGAIATNDDNTAAALLLLRSYGSKIKYHHEMLGTNSRLDELQAGYLSVKLKHLDRWNAIRKSLAGIYLSRLKNINGLSLPHVPEWAEPVWHVFPIRVNSDLRPKLIDHLTAKKIGYNIHYPVPIHEQKCYASLNYKPSDFPVASAQAQELLSLPLDAYHSAEEIELVCREIINFFSAR